MVSRLILSETNPQEDGSLQDKHHGNQDYKKVLRKTSVPVTGFMEVLGWTRTGLPSGYVICLHLKIRSNAVRRPCIARTGVHRITC